MRRLVDLTVWVNTLLFRVQHTTDGLWQGVNWEVYCQDPENLYVNLRWAADYRNLFWLFVFFMFCKFVYWVGMHLSLVCSNPYCG